MARNRLYQGALKIQRADKPMSWTLRSGWKAHITKTGYAGPPVRLTIESPEGSIRFNSLITTKKTIEDTNSDWARATVSIDSDADTDCYCHMEENMTPGGCLIATLLCRKLGYGEDAEALQVLREWRDYMLETVDDDSYPSMVVGQYYETSAYLVPVLEELDDHAFFSELEDRYLKPLLGAS